MPTVKIDCVHCRGRGTVQRYGEDHHTTCGMCAGRGWVMGPESQARATTTAELGVLRLQLEAWRQLGLQLHAALAVLVLSPATRAWLETNDPQALKQARRALAAFGIDEAV